MTGGLIIFAREPLPGRVKTRLAASVGDRAAAELYDAMLVAVLKTAGELSGVGQVVYWDCDEASLPDLATRYRCSSRRQAPGDLGQRMAGAFDEMFAEGYDVCCIIGSDAPDLPLRYLQDAFRLLEERQADVVFGPSRDGGYYLLGACRPWPQLFSGISWSSCAVLEQSLAAVHSAGGTTALLPQWQDIDTIEDLHAYRQRTGMAVSGEAG